VTEDEKTMTLKGRHHLSYLRQQHSAPHSENPGCGRRGLYPRTPDKGEGEGKRGEGVREGCVMAVGGWTPCL